ncbi:hypothetical protein C0Q70_08783 [Pomacea canaliculata]|uniref:Uncharacterized protein n=1 Tax=Pomacea canaliculata TaxID=400727 RepID=A0A2T7P7Y2_POMCA|nr:uncharacterized protein LOC112564364 [Pomacea canaliculata]PVD29532.1 hypothetical protein C0Q70_08783 [Pomacea canaliculata]
MSLAVLFLLTALTVCVLAGVEQQRLHDDGCANLEEKMDNIVDQMKELKDIVKTHKLVISKMKILEETVKKQAELIESILSEKHQRVAEKQSMKTSVKSHQTFRSPEDDILSTDGLANEKDALHQSPQLGEEILGSEKQKPGVFVRSDDSDPLLPVVTQLTQKVSEVSAGLQALKDEVDTNLQALRNEVRAGQRELKTEVSEASTSVFVRWGSSSCPESAVLVYSGEVGGSSYTATGAAANYLCLPLSNLTLMNISVSTFALLYGGEYETGDEHQEKDPLCAVCRSSRANNVMIPATTVCPAGWTSEYSGWLMGGNPPHNAASEFICVDFLMEERIASEENLNGKLLFYTSTLCGSLPCPPYVSGKRVTCVVCSK